MVRFLRNKVMYVKTLYFCDAFYKFSYLNVFLNLINKNKTNLQEGWHMTLKEMLFVSNQLHRLFAALHLPTKCHVKLKVAWDRLDKPRESESYNTAFSRTSILNINSETFWFLWEAIPATEQRNSMLVFQLNLQSTKCSATMSKNTNTICKLFCKQVLDLLHPGPIPA